MATKETKVILKQIREDIKNEKYTDAIGKCKVPNLIPFPYTKFYINFQDILKTDPENYMTLLLMGAAHQSFNKTEVKRKSFQIS